ncbi:hypothetical protein [Spirosoma oryzicola]|uniref:hypothetical protein n=1 Tax=Spirosoma oryzicola TaxID=2898794 RepID=UPI001E3AECA6|nr:hypothetical protein [Spirosoma oryzicola]UHG93041.1 hypothetical protein LQ777_09100 [Spirosoma oryzicola]
MLIKGRLYAFILLIFLGIGESCQQSSTVPVPADTAYFPLQVGDYWIYQVTQNAYSSTNPVAERVYQVQEKISSSYTQNGQVFFLMEESVKTSSQPDWQLTAIRTVYKNQSEVVRLENNVPVVKLLFPIAATTSWNTNIYNARPDTLLHYEDSGRSFTLDTRRFDNTISVVGANDSTLISQQKNRQVYASNVGLVYRENVSLAYCQTSPDCIGKGIVESGTRQKWVLVSSNHLP